MTVVHLNTPDQTDRPSTLEECMDRRSKLEVFSELLDRVDYCFSGTFNSTCVANQPEESVDCQPEVLSEGEFSPVYVFNTGSQR